MLRDMVFRGHRQFQQFAASPEGIATNTLADRPSERRLNWMTTEREDVIRYHREKLTRGEAPA